MRQVDQRPLIDVGHGAIHRSHDPFGNDGGTGDGEEVATCLN